MFGWVTIKLVNQDKTNRIKKVENVMFTITKEIRIKDLGNREYFWVLLFFNSKNKFIKNKYSYFHISITVFRNRIIK